MLGKLQLADDWTFPLDDASRIWLSVKGTWGLEVRCPPTDVKTAEGVSETFAPTLIIKGLGLEAQDWRDMVGLEVFQHGAWRGDGDPEASLFVDQSGEMFEATLRVVGQTDTALHVEIDAVCDIFVDDGHDTDVPLRLDATIPVEGVRFRFRADGVASRNPQRRASELLATQLTPSAFGEPDVKQLQPGIFEAFFPPTAKEPPPHRRGPVDKVDLTVSAEDEALRASGSELLKAFVQQGWLELEEGGLPTLVPEFVTLLESGGGGAERAERVAEWLIERDEVVDLHCSDEDLAKVLDQWW